MALHACLLALLGALSASAGVVPTHGWDTALESQFADFGYSCGEPGCVGITPFTPARAAAVVEKYAVISLEKCTGRNDTEGAIWASAALLKSLKPSLKVFFYLATDMGGFQCYSNLEFYLSRTDFHLHDDSGKVINASTNIPYLDYANPAATAWWASLPMNGTQYSHLIDGVLADSSGPPCPLPNVSPQRCAALAEGKAGMVSALQGLFNASNGGVVLQNLITMYGNQPRDGLDWLPYSTGVMGEHFAVFEDVLKDGSLNASKVIEFMEAVSTAQRAGKMVVIGTWPGLFTGFSKTGDPMWPGNTQPTTVAGWQGAMLDKHAFALAGFLTVAEENVFMQYEGAEKHPCRSFPFYRLA